jgi:hypothetical protein
MNQRRLVWRAFKEAGLLDSDDPRVQEVIRHVRDNPKRCWTDFVSDFRENYYDTFDKIAAALEQSNDPMIRNALIRFADTKQPKEQQLLVRIASNTDFEQDQVAAKRLGRLKIKQVEEALKRRSASGAESTASPTTRRLPTKAATSTTTRTRTRHTKS